MDYRAILSALKCIKCALKSFKAHRNVLNLPATRKVVRELKKYALGISFRAHFGCGPKRFKDTFKMCPENF
jgi:hypothetical protein